MQKDPTRLPPLDLLLAFDAAARHLSFTKAAAERFLTQSAISRQVKALEDDLGVSLFHRRHRALDLTDDGRRLRDSVRVALAGLRDAMVRIRAPQRREVLSLSTTPGLASLWLIPRLAELVKVQPGIDVRIDATLQQRDLGVDGFDLAIRYLPARAAVGTPLFAETIQLVCAPSLLRDKARPIRTLQDLRFHTLLQVDAPRAGHPLEWDLWLKAMGIAGLEPANEMMFTNYDAAIHAAVEGQGMALGRRPLIDALLKRGALVAPLKDEIATQRGYYLVIEPQALRRPAVRALETWLVEQARMSTEDGEQDAQPSSATSAKSGHATRGLTARVRPAEGRGRKKAAQPRDSK
jgi:DNA-binding transcriptional LysR family regulator